MSMSKPTVTGWEGVGESSTSSGGTDDGGGNSRGTVLAPVSGETNAQVRINAAIQSTADAGGGIVFLSAGEFIIDGSIILRPYVALVGAGQQVTTIRLAANTTTPASDPYMIVTLPASGTHGDGIDGASIRHLRVHGNRLNQGAGEGMGGIATSWRQSFMLDVMAHYCDLEGLKTTHAPDTAELVRLSTYSDVKSSGCGTTGYPAMLLQDHDNYYVNIEAFWSPWDTNITGLPDLGGGTALIYLNGAGGAKMVNVHVYSNKHDYGVDVNAKHTHIGPALLESCEVAQLRMQQSYNLFQGQLFDHQTQPHSSTMLAMAGSPTNNIIQATCHNGQYLFDLSGVTGRSEGNIIDMTWDVQHPEPAIYATGNYFSSRDSLRFLTNGTLEKSYGISTQNMYKETTANETGLSNGTGTVRDVTGLAQTITLTRTTYLQIEGSIQLQGSEAGQTLYAYLRDGSDATHVMRFASITAANQIMTIHLTKVILLGAGTHTVKMGTARAGTGTYSVLGDATYPNTLTIRELDIA